MSERGRARKYDKAIETKLRRCLFTKANGELCGKLFKSTGPGNRKCPACRDSEVLPYQAWMEDDHVISGHKS